MNLRGLGNIVSRKPLTVAIVILAITAVFGFYASQMQMSADLKTFLPKDEMINADMKISDQFGDTDIMELIFISNNTVSRESMEDMLNVEDSLIKDRVVSQNLKTPDSPGNSIISPADLIIMGNITLSFQNTLIKTLENMKTTMKGMNFTLLSSPLQNINAITEDYYDIYSNATEIREDAKSLVLMIYVTPQEGNYSMPREFSQIMENITAVIVQSADFSTKSKILTLLTPPPMNQTTGNTSMENLLMNYFIADMNSTTLNLSSKEISIDYFLKTNNFTFYSLNYTNTSLSGGIEENENMIYGLNNTENMILAGDNNTALNILNQTIMGMEENIDNMAMVLPYYQSYNNSLSNFMNDFYNGTISQRDIISVQENTSMMLNFATGDWRNMLLVFNDTFNKWLYANHIYYDMIYDANSTQQVCNGFIESYYSTVEMNETLTGIKMMINNDTIQNTTNHIEYVKNMLESENSNMETQKYYIQNALNGMNSPFARWFSLALSDLYFVLTSSPNIGVYGINIFNLEMAMMNSPSSGGSGVDMTSVFYSLKHAFESDVVAEYKYRIQDMFLREMNMMSTQPPMLNFTAPSTEISMPNFSPSVEEKRGIIENMSQSDIEKTIENVDNYNSTDIQNAVDSVLPLLENTSHGILNISKILKSIVNNTQFVYETTQNSSVKSSLLRYENMSIMMGNASAGFSHFLNYLPQMSGFSQSMKKFGSQMKSMFSKDFDGRRARACLMLVMLNSTYRQGETTKEHSDRMEKLEERVETVAKESNTRSEIRAMGSSLISKATEKTANETMNILLPVAMILIIVILSITFRSVVDTLLGLFGLGMAIVWAYGFGVIMNYSFNQISTTVAVLLVGLGIDYAIHTILRYREELRKGRGVRDSMGEMITHLGMGLVLATITSMVAFLSNISSPIPPLANFGVMNAVGIFGAFVIFTTVIPAIKILIDERREKKGKLKIKKEKGREGSGVIILNKAMSIGAIAAEKHRYIVIGIVLVMSIAGIYGGLNINTTFDVKDFLPSNLEISDTIEFMMNNFNSSGMSDNYVLIEGNITTPQALRAVNQTMAYLKDDKYVEYSQSWSITTVIKEYSEQNATFGRIVYENDTNHDGLPDRNIDKIYAWVYENTDEGKQILHRSNNTFDSMLIIISSSASTDKEDKMVYEEVNNDIKPLKDTGLRAIPTGASLLTYHILDLLEGSQWNSLIITLIASFIVLEIIFLYERRSFILGIITSLPVLISLLWILGTMYAVGIPFNVITVTVTSLTIGLGITYSIHITHRFLEDMEREENIEAAIRKTLRHTGTSIFGAAATTIAGFGTLGLSTMPPIRQFGEVSALSILYSFLLAVFILPTFLYFWAKWRERRENTPGAESYVISSIVVIGAGSIIYGLSFYLRWIGWRLINSPSSFLIAIAGVLVILLGGEIYYRGRTKKGKL